MNPGTPMLGFCAWSGTGKTTLLRQLIPLLTEKGLRTGIVKHAHHRFDIDQPGKDSYVLREAGAVQVLVASRRRMAWIREIDEDQDEPSLADALGSLDLENLDLVLVEGFKHEHYSKIEVHRPSLGKPLMYPDDPDIIAIASDEPVHSPANSREIVRLNMNQPDQVAAFIIDTLVR